MVGSGSGDRERPRMRTRMRKTHLQALTEEVEKKYVRSGGGGGGGESMAGPIEEEGIGTVKGNKDVEIGGEVLGSRGVRDDRGDLKENDD